MSKIEQRRAALRRFFDRYGPRSRNRVCKAAGVAESAVRAFMKGGDGAPQHLAEKTYDALSDYSGWSIDQLKGDAPPPPIVNKGLQERDVPEQESVPEASDVSDLSKGIGQTATRTPDRPGSEGSMEDQLRLELVDRIWDLPADRLASIKKHFDAIEHAMARVRVPPLVRGKTAE